MFCQIIRLNASEGALPAPVLSLVGVGHLMRLHGLTLSEHLATVATLVPGKLVNTLVGIQRLGCLCLVVTFRASKASVVCVVHCKVNVMLSFGGEPLPASIAHKLLFCLFFHHVMRLVTLITLECETVVGATDLYFALTCSSVHFKHS